MASGKPTKVGNPLGHTGPSGEELNEFDYGFGQTVTTGKKSLGQQISSINLKDSGLGNPQTGTGGSRHKRTGRRVT